MHTSAEHAVGAQVLLHERIDGNTPGGWSHVCGRDTALGVDW
jgi:hypothetical protein